MAPLTVERQGREECALATMAALAGRPLAEVRGIAHEEAVRYGMPFHKHVVLDCIARRVGGQRLAVVCGFDLVSGIVAAASRGRTEAPGVRRLGPRTRTLPRRGRGVVRVHMRRRYHVGHAMPWADGLLYDPNTPDQPTTLGAWLRTRPWATVSYVTVDSAHDVGYNADHGADAPASE